MSSQYMLTKTAYEQMKQAYATMSIEQMKPSAWVVDKVAEVKCGHGTYDELRKELAERYRK